MIRLQEAIKDDNVKRIGGKNLFNPKTYQQCLQGINDRLKNNLNAIYKEANELENHAPIKSYQKAKIIEYIDKLRNFDTLAKAFNESGYGNNKKFLAHVANVLPTFIRNAWEKKQAALETKQKKVTLSKLIDVLVEFIPSLEVSIRNEAFTKKDKDEKDKRKPSYSHSLNCKSDRHDIKNDKPKKANHSLNYNNSDRHDNKAKNHYKCWFHKNNTHYFNKCRELWQMDGRKVAEIAKKNGICTYCGRPWDTHKNCPTDNVNLKCRIEGCNFPHHSIFCYKRKPTENTPKERLSNDRRKPIESVQRNSNNKMTKNIAKPSNHS